MQIYWQLINVGQTIDNDYDKVYYMHEKFRSF